MSEFSLLIEGWIYSIVYICYILFIYSSGNCCLVAQLCSTLCDLMDCSTPGFPAHPISQSLLKLMSIESAMPSNHLILCRPLLLLPSIFPSIRVFSNELALRIRWPKYWSFSFSISSFSEYSGLISFRIDWLDLLTAQGTLKSLLQHHNLKASILWCSAFFIVQLSHPYKTTGKTIALTIWTFVGKVMSLLFNMLSRFVIAFFPKEQASFNFMAAATICSDFGAPQNKVSHCFPNYLPWSDGSSLSLLSRGSLVPLHFLTYWYLSWQSWFQLVLHPVWHFTWCTLHIS